MENFTWKGIFLFGLMCPRSKNRPTLNILAVALLHKSADTTLIILGWSDSTKLYVLYLLHHRPHRPFKVLLPSEIKI